MRAHPVENPASTVKWPQKGLTIKGRFQLKLNPLPGSNEIPRSMPYSKNVLISTLLEFLKDQMIFNFVSIITIMSHFLVLNFLKQQSLIGRLVELNYFKLTNIRFTIQISVFVTLRGFHTQRIHAKTTWKYFPSDYFAQCVKTFWNFFRIVDFACVFSLSVNWPLRRWIRR